ncbi:MAG: hypothetical protein IKF71_01635 [Bacilli bacterium]|nr:hypothetical protein [Bacilli bacterium]
MDKKMSHTKFIVLTLLFYVFLYIVLKLFIVYTQDLYMDNAVYEKQYNIGKVLDITSYSQEEQEQTDYFESNANDYRMKVKNYFQDFEAGDKDVNYEYYLLYNEDNDVTAAFMMGEFETKIHNIKNYDESSYYFEFNHFPLYISNILREYYLNKHEIHDDVELIKYIRERKKEDGRFLTPIVSIKENYFFNFIETNLPNLDNITYIEGDLNGYMYETDTYKQACIIHNNKLYCLTFYKLDYFTDEMIVDIIRSLVIE